MSTALVFAVGGYLTLQGRMTVGTLIAFSTYLMRALGTGADPAGVVSGLAAGAGQLGTRVQEIIRQTPVVSSPADPVRLPTAAHGDLRIDQVRFSYQAGGLLILDGAELNIPAGQKLAIVEPPVGKSTLIDLLQRHYDPLAGCIRLDGINLRNLDLTELRRSIVVISQDVVLFPGTLAENLRYVCPEGRYCETTTRPERRSAGCGSHRGIPGRAGYPHRGRRRRSIRWAAAAFGDCPCRFADPGVDLDEATSAVDVETAAASLPKSTGCLPDAAES
ncbi:MAG: ABC transporter ATP-binding protein [Candidatus Competibacteraceae bacterium]